MQRTVQAKAPGGPAYFLSGGGDMGALIRSMDWSNTPIGPVERWSPTLRTMVSFLLANRFPLLLWWGPEYVSIYNDAYRPILGTKHPGSVGLPCRECWAEIWHILEPLIDAPFTGGPATWMDDIPLEINRHGFVEETHFTVAYSPVPDETAPRGIGGVLATVHEITEKVVAERRVLALRDLGARTAEAKTADDACAAAAETLAGHAKDVPFALLYLIDGEGTTARLAGTAGVAAGDPIGPAAIALDRAAASGGWPLAEAVRREQIVVVDDLAGRFGRVPAGPWSDPPHTAVVVPVRSTTAHRLAGFLVAGVSPRLKLDELYRSFFDLVAGQVATSIANACAYEEERRRAEALAEIDRAKTAFFSNVSHEFRTPLTLMLGPIEDAVQNPAAAVPLVRDELALVHRNGLRLLRLVNTLLDFSRIEAGRVQASYEPVDLPAFTAELASIFHAATDKAGLTLAVDCPPLRQPVYVDRAMWEKVVLNLVSNAFKFTLTGGIAVRLRAAGPHAVLAVEDTGTGIPAAELPRLFDRFYRVEGARGRTHEGTGIGLALVQELVKLHGGTVRVDSVLDKGSTFEVTIPFGSAHLPQDRLQAKATRVSTAVSGQAYVEEALRWMPGDAGGGMAPGADLLPSDMAPAAGPGTRARVLIADDNADMRDYLCRLLAGSYAVQGVADGAAALAAIRTRRPDLLLSDVMMPRLDGFALIGEIRADPALADMPVVLLSARAGQDASIEGLEAGADDYLIKPFSARELLARVSANLKLASLRRSLRKEHEEHQRLLIDELNHRVKNTLATVQSIAMHTFRNRQDIAQAQEQFVTRLLALSKAHDILTHQNWQGAFLGAIVDEAVAAYRADAGRRFEIEGPSVWISTKQALALSMALHELCTNAAKYGALSDGRGRVRINWSVAGVNGSRTLHVEWSEAGGPPVLPRPRTGFGSRLIERGLSRDLRGNVKLDFAAAGVTCLIEAPLEYGDLP